MKLTLNTILRHLGGEGGGVWPYFDSFLTVTPDGASSQLEAALALFPVLIVLETG